MLALVHENIEKASNSVIRYNISDVAIKEEKYFGIEITGRVENNTSKDETIDSLKYRIADLQRTIADKEEIIKARDARILELERRIAQINAEDLSHYHFPIGAAEERTNPHNKNILK